MRSKALGANGLRIGELLLSLLALAACSRAPLRPAATVTAPTTPDLATVSVTGQPRPTAAFLGQVSIPHATIHYYPITGSTAEAIRAQMNAKGPLDDAGDRVDALTEWYVSWNWPGYGWRMCFLGKVTVNYSVQVTLPYWDPPPEAAPELISSWEHFIAALANHERGHVDHIVQNVHTVEEVIQEATCLSAEEAAQSVLAEFRAFDIAYDTATQHGATQGVRFP
jgi:predicted secreted Zn-dependent protease